MWHDYIMCRIRINQNKTAFRHKIYCLNIVRFDWHIFYILYYVPHLMWKARFHTHRNSRENSSSVYFKFYIFKKAEGKRKDSGGNCSINSLNLICSLFLHSCNFIALVPFQIFEPCYIFKRFIWGLFVVILSCILSTRNEHILSFLSIYF
jgi:hypothetical protein